MGITDLMYSYKNQEEKDKINQLIRKYNDKFREDYDLAIEYIKIISENDEYDNNKNDDDESKGYDDEYDNIWNYKFREEEDEGKIGVEIKSKQVGNYLYVYGKRVKMNFYADMKKNNSSYINVFFHFTGTHDFIDYMEHNGIYYSNESSFDGEIIEEYKIDLPGDDIQRISEIGCVFVID